MKFESFYIHFLVILSCVFTLVSCEEVVDIDLSESEAGLRPRLVIEASINHFPEKDSIPELTEAFVFLSTTAPFFDTIRPVVELAEVTIYDPVNDITYDFKFQEEFGVFVSNFVPEFDIPYELEVLYEGQRFVSTTQMQPTSPIVEVSQEDIDTSTGLFDDQNKEVRVVIADDESRRNFYLVDFDKGNFITTNDRFYNGQSFDFSYFYEKAEIGETLTIKALGMDRRFVQFMETILSQSGENGGGPFATPAATVRGNIVNRTEPDFYPLGYFRISEGSRQRVEITR